MDDCFCHEETGNTTDKIIMDAHEISIVAINDCDLRGRPITNYAPQGANNQYTNTQITNTPKKEKP